MQNEYLQPSDSESREYKLTGRLWIFLTAIVVCAAASQLFRHSNNTEWIGYYGAGRFYGLPREEVNAFLSLMSGILATLLFLRLIATPWIMRILTITPQDVTIIEAKFAGQSRITIPLYEMRGVKRFIRPSFSEKSSRLTEQARQAVQFEYQQKIFTFYNRQFGSNRDFEDFCMRVGAGTMGSQ